MMKVNIYANSHFCLICAAIAIFFLSGCRHAQSNGAAPFDQEAAATPAIPISPPDEIPALEIASDDVSSLALETVYKDYFDENSKCRQTYNEFFGEADGFYSRSSPCTINFTFERSGAAVKILEISRYDKAAKAKKTVEKSVWTGRISGRQFDALARSVTDNEAFRNWRDGTMITTSNTKVSAVHSKGTRAVMSSVDEKTIRFLPLLDAFKRLDKEIKWEKAR